MKGGHRNKKLSVGTKFMLVLTVTVLIGSALVIGKLSSGASVDLGKLNMNVLDLQDDQLRTSETADTEEKPAAVTQSAAKREETQRTETEAVRKEENSFTLTIGGSISLSGEVRKNSKSTDAKVADYTDIMMLLAPQIRSDVSAVFFENILSDRHKAADNVATEEAAVLLSEAGFGMAACGFSQAYANGKDGVEATLMSLDNRGIISLGISYADQAGNPVIRTINGVKTAFMQYTSTVPAKTRKTMVRDGTDGMVPEAELSLIKQDIDLARQQGAEAVIVLLSWGKTGSSNPDKAQRELAQGIASAGADLIVGCGSHMPQTAEYLQGAEGRSVLCAWSLGTLLGGDRSNIKRMSGYLLHVTVRSNGQDSAVVLNPEYTPVYTWKYKQDGRFYYRCIVSNSEAPDGMDSDQRKTMVKASETVASVLKEAPVSERGKTDDP